MGWTVETSNGNETGKIKNRVAFYTQGQGLDLGSGPQAWKVGANESIEQNCIGVDMAKDADVVRNLGDLSVFADESFDWVFSSHALEDFKNTEATLREWWKKVKVGGFFILYLPLTRRVAKEMGLPNWESFYPNMGEEGANVRHQQDLHPQEIRDAIARIGHASIEADEIRGEGDEYSFLLVFKKLSSYKLGYASVEPLKQKRALVVRLGACGDNVQASMVPRLLKQQGYHVTFSASGYGAEVLKHNPHIDELVLQRKDQVPPTELNKFWADVAKRYDLFVNLTGSVEDKLLFPDRVMYDAMRKLEDKFPEATELQRMDAVFQQFRKIVGEQNYYDSTLEKAGLTERGLNGEIYFSPEEELAGAMARDKYRGKFVVLWSLAGSSYHKWYPWFDHVVARMMAEIPEVVIISVGEEACMLMERAESPRYKPRSGRWGWRQTFLWCKNADLVIGPETGVLNAAGCFDTPKICLRSHSSHENLCKYWKNDYCISPELDPAKHGIACHPCHTLHYTHPIGEFCKHCGVEHTTPETMDAFTKKEVEVFGDKAFWSCPYVDLDEQGPFPQCMAQGISPERVMEQVRKVYAKWKATKEPLVQIA